MNFTELLNTDIRMLFKFKRKTKKVEPKDKSTLQLLNDIITLLAPPPKLESVPGITVWDFSNRIDVMVNTETAKRYIIRHPLPFIETDDFGSSGGCYTLRDKQLYYRYYRQTSLQEYVTERLVPFHEALVDCEAHMNKVLNDYNLPMLTSFNMLKDSMAENQGKPTDEVVRLFKEIMDRFTLSIEEKFKQIKAHEKALKEATNQSHIAQMKLELEHIDTFIRGDGFDVE